MSRFGIDYLSSNRCTDKRGAARCAKLKAKGFCQSRKRVKETGCRMTCGACNKGGFKNLIKA